jgi:hypothetical protein
MEDELEQHLLEEFGPNRQSLDARLEVVKIVKKIVHGAFPNAAIQIGEYGSLPLRTFLKTGDIDITIIAQEIPFVDFALHILTRVKMQFESLPRQPNNLIIEDISLINAEVPILKLKINHISADITVNQIKALSVVYMFEELNKLIPKNLLKRSIVLCKIWACYFGRILGGMYGNLTSYALETLVLFVINTIPASRSSPIKVLEEMIRFFTDFDWENNVITFCRVLSVSEYISVITHNNDLYKNATNLLITPSKLAEIKSRLQSPKNMSIMPLKHVNILDPFENTNNLGKSVSANNSKRLKEIFRISAEIIGENGVNAIFPNKSSLPAAQVVIKNVRMPLVMTQHNEKLSENAYVDEKVNNYEIFKGSYRKSQENFRKSFRSLLANPHKNRIRDKREISK